MLKGKTKNQLLAYIDGTEVIKKCNVVSHTAKGTAHDTAFLALSDNPPDELSDLFTKKITKCNRYNSN